MNDTSNKAGSRREFLTVTAAAAATLAATALPAAPAQAQPARAGAAADVVGYEHWAVKRAGNDNVRLFMWRKQLRSGAGKGTILFVHGSSVSSTPVFDLQIAGRPESSTGRCGGRPVPEPALYGNQPLDCGSRSRRLGDARHSPRLRLQLPFRR